MKISRINSNVNFSSIVVKDNSNAMGILNYHFQFASSILEKAPNLLGKEEVKYKTNLLEKLSKAWRELSTSEDKNIVLSANPDIADKQSIKSIVAAIEYIKKGKPVTVGTISGQESICQFAEKLLSIQKKSFTRRLLHL